MGTLLKKIYDGEIASKSDTLEMLDFMNKTDFEDRIPTGVPTSVKTYHKTGDEIGKLHDAAIVDNPNHPYILVVLTADITDEDKTKETIANISKLVYDFMRKRS
jgi:beta-lactamase class A